MDMQSDDCAWFRREHEIEVRDDVSFSAFSSDGEVGIMLSAGENDLDLKTEEAAFLFGDNQDDLWFMPRMGSFYKVSLNPEEEPVATKLYNQHSGTYRNCSLVNDIRVSVPVFRDALDMIPINTTHDVKLKGECIDVKIAASVQEHKSDEIVLTGAEHDEAIEKKVTDYLASTEKYYEEIMKAVDREIDNHGGKIIVRYRPGTNHLYSYDLAAIKNRLFIITYAEFNGEWLADEEAFNGEPPLWFSESDHRVSPVFQAMRCRDYFNQKLSGTDIRSVVVLPDGCSIINAEDVQRCWCENCTTTVVRTMPSEGTDIKTLHDYVLTIPPSTKGSPQYDNLGMISISSSFAMNQNYWITP